MPEAAMVESNPGMSSSSFQPGWGKPTGKSGSIPPSLFPITVSLSKRGFQDRQETSCRPGRGSRWSRGGCYSGVEEFG